MKTNVLIFPAGEQNSVELHDALVHNVNIGLYGASSIDRHGPFLFRNYCGDLPFITSDTFFPELNKLLIRWKIDCIFPTHDDIALFLAKNREKICAKVIVASERTALVCRDKEETYSLFSGCDFCPKTYDAITEYPVFIKPRRGQGSKGAALVLRKEDIPNDFSEKDFVVCEYLPGEEVTVDCLTDSNGRLRACLPRIRKRMLAGVCVSGVSEQASEEILRMAQTINNKLEFLGLWYFQIKKDTNDRFKLLEISTRCAGTMCLSRARGVNLPLLSVYACMGKDITVFENPYTVETDRVLYARYRIDYEYDEVYVDYDDTVVEKETVCIPVLAFLFQCRNKGKRIVLLSRHETDHADSLEEDMRRHAISADLFDSIVKVGSSESKSDFIENRNAIFIDNAYSERKAVHDKLGIPVFDVEGMEVILDWRI